MRAIACSIFSGCCLIGMAVTTHGDGVIFGGLGGLSFGLGVAFLVLGK